MTCFYLFFGLFFIGVGFAVKAVPNLIAGYNALTKEQKKQVDIKGLSSHLRNSFIGMGLFIIIGYYLLAWLGLYDAVEILVLVAIYGGVIYIFVKSRKYSLKKKKTKKTDDKTDKNN